VTVDERNGRALFYYFVEAPQGASTKPLLLWLNGGEQDNILLQYLHSSVKFHSCMLLLLLDMRL